MRKYIAIIAVLSLIVSSCKTKYIETVHYQPVEVHDTLVTTAFLHDSITVRDSIFIHKVNDTVYSERWKVEYKWRTRVDTVTKVREVPKVFTDTIYQVKEVPVDKIVYQQKWWQKSLSTIGGLFLVGFLLSLIINKKRII